MEGDGEEGDETGTLEGTGGTGKPEEGGEAGILEGGGRTWIDAQRARGPNRSN